MAPDNGFYTKNDKILGGDIQQYIIDKSKLSEDRKNSIESFINIAKFINNDKNLIVGACFSARYDNLFGISVSSIVKSRDIFINRDYSSNYIVKDKGVIPFKNFISYNQTSQKNYINGWVWYRNGEIFQQNFNIIMTKYGVKTIK